MLGHVLLQCWVAACISFISLLSHQQPHSTLPCCCADVRTLMNNLTLDWSSSAPAGLRSADFWVGRFSFVLLAPTSGNYTLNFAVDDIVSVQLDGEQLLAPGGSRRTVVWLQRGFHDVVLHYVEAAGSASLRVTWDGGVLNAVSWEGGVAKVQLAV